MKNHHSHILLLTIALTLAMAGCSSQKADDGDPISDEQIDSVDVRPEVIFSTADDKPLYQYVESSGVVEADRQVTLKPKISGFVGQSKIVEGHWVKKGDTLLAFLSEEWQFALQEAQNTYRQKRSAYRIEKRQRTTLPGNTSDSLQSDGMVRIATGLAKADIALKRAELNLSYATLTAPFSGRLATDNHLTKGTYISAGTVLGQLVNDATVRVRFDVLESEFNKLKTGLTVEITAPGGQAVMGKITAISPVVDTHSKTGQVIVNVNNRRHRLRPGMTVDGRILVQKQTGKARIPRSAILSRDGGRTLVFKLHSDTNEVEWVYVTPVAENSDWAIVDNPKIAPGDTLAVDNHFALSHLQVVSPKMESMQREGNGNPELQKQ